MTTTDPPQLPSIGALQFVLMVLFLPAYISNIPVLNKLQKYEKIYHYAGG